MCLVAETASVIRCRIALRSSAGVHYDFQFRVLPVMLVPGFLTPPLAWAFHFAYRLFGDIDLRCVLHCYGCHG